MSSRRFGLGWLMGGKDESNIAPAQIASDDVDADKFSLTSLQEMRNEFPGVPDVTLAQYLIARKDDFEKASALLKGCLAWKTLYFPILKSSLPTEFPIGKIMCKGVDKEGRPLLIWCARKNIAKDRDINEAGRLLMWWTEYTLRQLPSNMTKFTVLIDRSEFTRENSDLELVKHTTSRFQDLYPERLQRVVIYPADFLFYTIWNVGKWFLDPVTRDKVQPMLQLSGVQQFIDDEHIPATMGGTSAYSYNANDFADPYSEEELALAKNRGFEPDFGSMFASSDEIHEAAEAAAEAAAKTLAEKEGAQVNDAINHQDLDAAAFAIAEEHAHHAPK